MVPPPVRRGASPRAISRSGSVRSGGRYCGPPGCASVVWICCNCASLTAGCPTGVCKSMATSCSQRRSNCGMRSCGGCPVVTGGIAPITPGVGGVGMGGSMGGTGTCNISTEAVRTGGAAGGSGGFAHSRASAWGCWAGKGPGGTSSHAEGVTMTGAWGMADAVGSGGGTGVCMAVRGSSTCGPMGAGGVVCLSQSAKDSTGGGEAGMEGTTGAASVAASTGAMRTCDRNCWGISPRRAACCKSASSLCDHCSPPRRRNAKSCCQRGSSTTDVATVSPFLGRAPAHRPD